MQVFLQQLQRQKVIPDEAFINRWASELSTEPSDFFKRKFDRDHRLNSRQER